jgi:hypothetical protein
LISSDNISSLNISCGIRAHNLKEFLGSLWSK